MKKKVIFGGMVGACVMIAFSLTLLMMTSDFSNGLVSSVGNAIIGVISILLAPFAGGFLAGLIARSDPRKAGLIAGAVAGVSIFAAWLIISGLTFSTIASGLAIIFTWAVLARVAGGFTGTTKSRRGQ